MASKEYANYRFLATNPETSGNTTIIPAVFNKQILIISILAVATGTVTLKFSTDSGVISGDMALLANSGFSVYNPGGVCISRVGGPIIVNLSASVKVGLTITYETV